MADNTQQTGADTIATDDVATLNGAASSGVKVQRMKVGFGADGDYTDASAAAPLPVAAASLPLPTGAATQVTLAALLTAAQAIETAVEALDGKTVTVDTGAIAGTVALDAPTLAALENIQATTGGLTNAELRAAAVPVSGPLTNTELRAAAVLTSHEAPPFLRVGFAEVGSNLVGKAAEELTLLQTGAGMAVSQSAGNLVITTGTTTNAETVIRSVDTFAGSLLARMKVILSQRIINQTFRLELADLVGDGLAYTINSSTSVTVTFPTTNPFTASNVGQSLRLSRITGAAGIPGRYAIASVSGLTVTFTVAGWPATGTGTLTLYGWNYIASEYSGTVATNSSFDAQRRGWNSGNTTATINTTASPGHVAQIAFDVHTAGYSDALVASNTGYQWTNRASRVENLPDPDTPLYLFIVVQNGSTAPASTTTLTVGFIQVEDQGRQKVRIASSDPAGSHALPVQVLGGLLGTQPVSGTVTANIGTGALAAGTNAIGDVGLQVRANATGAATAHHVVAAATTNVAQIKATAGRVVGWQLANTTASWRYVKLHNVASATAGAAVAMTIGIPPNGTASASHPTGIGFATAISRSIVTGAADADATATAANDVVGDIFFA